MNTEDILTVLVMALVTGTTALTITRTYIFQRPRNWLRARGEWWDKLVTCPYCTGHWIALGLMFLFQPRLLKSCTLAGDLGDAVCFLATWFVIVALASFVVGLIWAALGSISPPPPLNGNGKKKEANAA